MRREIFRIESERLLKLFDGLVEEFIVAGLRRRAALELGAFEQGLAELVDYFVVLAEIESAFVQFGIAILEDAAKLGNGLVEEAVLFVHKTVEPRHGPARSRRLGFGGALQRSDGVIEAAFLE